MFAGPTALTRLDEKLWSFKPNTKNSDRLSEIRISTPGFSNRSLDYELVCKVVELFHQQEGRLGSFSLSEEDGVSPDLQTVWKLENITERWLTSLQVGNIYTQKYSSLPFQIFEIKPDSLCQRLYWAAIEIFDSFQNLVGFKASAPITGKIFSKEYQRNLDIQETCFLQNGAFQDPFTELASTVFQRDETPFVSESKHKGSYRFVLREGRLELESLAEPIKLAANGSDPAKEAVLAYRDFLRASFSWRILDSDPVLFDRQIRHYGDIFLNFADKEEQFFGFLSSTFGIDFDEMIKQKKPLLPDHVFKCNIAVCNIELPQVESLFLRIATQLSKLNFVEEDTFSGPTDFFTYLKKKLEERNIGDLFSNREKRGLYLAFSRFSGASLSGAKFGEFVNFLSNKSARPQNEINGEKVRELEPEAFQKLMEILLPDTNLIENGPDFLFTGKKINHLAICGYKTMGNPQEYDPSRNLFELLQIYKQLSRCSKEGLYELLAHVVAKKSLWSEYPLRPQELSSMPTAEQQKNVRRVGRLIPFAGENNQIHWYLVDGLLNDGAGDVNYALVPASKRYTELQKAGSAKRAPLIKLYRSTSSDPEAESSIDSLLADTNPKRIGSLDFNRGDEYEKTYFNRCSMPLWVAYLISGDLNTSARAFEDLKFERIESPDFSLVSKRRGGLKDFLAWQIREVFRSENAFEEAERRLAAFEEKIGSKTFEKFFAETVEGKEWDRNKIAQDIVYIGHSLGGALSQSAMIHFGPKVDRIPLYGCQYKCYAYDSPGITIGESTALLRFGRTHKDLLKFFGQKWEIHYQFEYGDVVPEMGACFLGVEGYEENQDQDWLEITGIVYKPKETADELSIITMPSHGRRFREIKNPFSNYTSSSLSISEMGTLKNSFFLPEELREKFGYKITIPIISERFIRQGILGEALFAYYWLKKKLVPLRAPFGYEVDKNGVLFCTATGYNACGRGMASDLK